MYHRRFNKMMRKIFSDCFLVAVNYVKEHFWDDEFASDFSIMEFLRETFPPESGASAVLTFNILRTCIALKSCLELIMDTFCILAEVSVPHSQKSEVLVLFDCVLFQMDLLGAEGLEVILNQINTELRKAFLKFIYDDNQMEKVQTALQKLYSPEFIEQELLSIFRRWVVVLPNVIEAQGSAQKKSPKRTVLPLTVPIPFNLTCPKPMAIPIPEPIPDLQKMRSPPNTLYKTPREFEILKIRKEKNHKEIEQLKRISDQLQPSCARPVKGNRHKCQSTHEEDVPPKSQLVSKQFETSTRKPTVNTNTAAILREWKLFKDKEEIQRERLYLLEAGAFSNAKYNEWRKKQERFLNAVRRDAAEKQRLNVLQTQEAAFEAKQALYQKKRDAALKLTNEICQLREQAAKMRAQDECQSKALVQQIVTMKKQVKEAHMKVRKEKRKAVSEIRAEKEVLHAKRREFLKALAEERHHAKQLIRASRMAWLYEKSNRIKGVDITETPGHGFLGEMSIAEMNERLVISRKKAERALEIKRDQIIDMHEKKNALLYEALERIGQHRSVNTFVRAISEHRAHSSELAVELGSRNAELVKLTEELLKKKSARLALRAEQKNIKKEAFPTSLLGNANKLEKDSKSEHFWNQLQKARYRAAQERTGSSHHPNFHVSKTPWGAKLISVHE